MYERGYRFLNRSVLMLLGIPLFYLVWSYGVAYMSGPDLYEGDRIEMRTCRQCGGSAKDEQMAIDCPQLGDRCPFCAGKGTVEVIIPGPNRPSRIWGAVISRDASGGSYDYSNPENIRMLPLQTAFMPEEMRTIQGGLARAQVVFEAAGRDTVKVTTITSGRFGTLLPPAIYTVTVTCEGFQTLQGKIEVSPLEAPIWLEKATLVEEPGGPEEAQSSYGISVLAAMARPGEEAGFLRAHPAGF